MTPHSPDTVSRPCRHKETETETVTRDGEETGTENSTEKKTFTETVKTANEGVPSSSARGFGGKGRKPSRAAWAKAETAVVTPYKPTQRELASQAAYAKRRESKRPVPQIKVSMSEDGGSRIASLAVDHPDPALGYELLAEAVGADNGTFLAGTLDSLAKVAQVGSVREGEMNYALSMVCGLRPKDQIEATLGVQMAAIHMATMNAAMCMGQAKTWELKDRKNGH